MPEHTMRDLLEIMRRLRDPDGGCPWDLEQDFSTIAPYTIEEAYEVADAIANGTPADLCDELGDLLFQVVFHAQMAAEASDFTFDDVVTAICDKMIRRHPHVFADADERDAEQQTVAWEDVKAQERANKRAAKADNAPTSVLDDVPLALPALMRAEKLSKRAARLGFDWPDSDAVFEKLDEEIGETREAIAQKSKFAMQDEIGDILFTVVNLARKEGIDPEEALRHANRKFDQRFRAVEKGIFDFQTEQGQNPTLAEMDQFWCNAKRLSP